MSSILLVVIIVAVLLSSAIFCIWYWLRLRKGYAVFTDTVYQDLDIMITGGKLEDYDILKETLLSKIHLKTKQLSDVIAHHEQVNISQKEEIQSMVSDISHQLNTPMANILMYNETILNNTLPREKERECIEIIQSQVLKMEFLIKSLIKMSRLENNVIMLNKTRTRVDEVIGEALSGISAKATAKGISLEMEDTRGLTLLCDPKWTNEAITNILDNAVKYTPSGGRINITTLKLELYTKISIIDTGIGIAEENINNIFKRFFREGKVHQEEGIGLGLYLTRQIITQQGGYIKVDSNEGAGTTFSIYLPN